LNDLLKQRLVGALILVALGVIFWPIIFIEPISQPVSQASQLPPRPLQPQVQDVVPAPPPGLPLPEEQPDWLDSDPVDVSLPSATEAALQADEATRRNEAPSEPTRPVPRDSAPETPRLDEQGLPIAWVLQVATVSAQASAEGLRDRLSAQGHKAYMRPLSRDGKTLYRVYIGPQFERAQLATAKRAIDAEFGVNAIISRYQP
jgi:DedD protein